MKILQLLCIKGFECLARQQVSKGILEREKWVRSCCKRLGASGMRIWLDELSNLLISVRNLLINGVNSMRPTWRKRTQIKWVCKVYIIRIRSRECELLKSYFCRRTIWLDLDYATRASTPTRRSFHVLLKLLCIRTWQRYSICTPWTFLTRAGWFDG